jgi:hypothetical protein
VITGWPVPINRDRHAEASKEILACGAPITWFLDGSMTRPSAILAMLFGLARDDINAAATDDFPTASK